MYVHSRTISQTWSDGCIHRRTDFVYVDFSLVVACFGAGLSLLIAMLLFDAQEWHLRRCCPRLGRLLQVLGISAICGFTLVGAVLSSETYPAYPLAVFLFGFPLRAPRSVEPAHRFAAGTRASVRSARRTFLQTDRPCVRLTHVQNPVVPLAVATALK